MSVVLKINKYPRVKACEYKEFNHFSIKIPTKMKSWLVSIVIGALNLYRKFTENHVEPKSVRHHYFGHVNTNLNNEIFETFYKL